MGAAMPVKGEKYRAIRDLLLDSFTLPELEQFLKLNGYDDVAHAVSPNVGPADFCFQIVEALDRMGRSDSNFFDRLNEARPAKAAQINAVRQLVLSTDRTSSPEDKSGTTDIASISQQPRSTDPMTQPSTSRIPTNPSAEELASLLDARLPGVLGVVGAEQTNRKTPQTEAQEFISQLRNFHANIVDNLRANRIVAAYELIGDFKETVARFLNDPLNRVVTRFRYADAPEPGQDLEYDSLVDERLRNYERAEDLYPGGEAAKLIKQQKGDRQSR
jgi:hypothetical protein